MYLFGISASLRAFAGLLALSSKTSLSLSKNSMSDSSNNGQRDPASIPTGWERLLNSKICSILEKQDLFHAHYAAMGNPSWKLDLQPSGECVLEFTETTTGGENTVAKYKCRLVGSESNTARTFLWAIPPDPTMGIPHSLLETNDPLVTIDVQTSLFQTSQEIPITATINGYSIALMAGALLEPDPAKAVFLGPYGDETGTLYLLITDTQTYPSIQDDRPKLERLKGFVSMAAEIPFITNHRVAFEAFAKDLGLSVSLDKNEEQKIIVTDDRANDSVTAYFDSEDNMKRLGDLALMTTDELEATKAAQAANQERAASTASRQQEAQTTPSPPPAAAAAGGGNPNNKCAQLQMNFFQKVMDESVSNQRQLFLDVAKALDLTISPDSSYETAKEVEAWDPATGEAVVGVFNDDNLMSQWKNIKKEA